MQNDGNKTTRHVEEKMEVVYGTAERICSLKVRLLNFYIKLKKSITIFMTETLTEWCS